MGFQLVLKSVTWNNLERRLHYFNDFVKPEFRLITTPSSI